MVFDITHNDCAHHLHEPILQAVAKTESAYNPYAIGVVGGHLLRQPTNKVEAVATALSLKAKGFNYSMGCLQVNQVNLEKYGLTHETVFDPERNIKAGAAILEECRARAFNKYGATEAANRATLSCYYSGNFIRGQQKEGTATRYADKSYVDKVLSNYPSGGGASSLVIPVIVTKHEKIKSKRVADAGETPNNEGKKPATWDVFGDY